MTHLQNSYNVKLTNRRELQNGSVKYDLKIVDESKKKSDNTVVDTTYTVSKKQEDPEQPGPDIKDMVKSFAKKKCKEYEQNIGKDFSGKNFSI